MANPRVGDIGTVFNGTVREDGAVVNLTGSTGHILRFEKPGGEALDVTPVIVVAADGTIRHTFTSGQLDSAGRWKAQLYFVLGAWSGWSSIGSFEIDSVLAAPPA